MARLLERDVDPDPLRQFTTWFDEARAAGVFEPEAMALATAAPEGAPSARMVLLKGFDERGFVFFTNYDSRKSRELEANPQAALLFHWKEIGRQVRIEGSVERVPAEETAAYVRTRSRASQLGALASPQSREIGSREELEALVEEVERRYRGGELPIPASWGGFRLDPRVYELWQHGEARLHDRLQYRREPGGGWALNRLAP
jgi:pyridoxamine 5'-phosphate oxidase